MTAKEILAKIKAVFDVTPAPVPAPVPTPAPVPAPAAMAAKTYKLQDGVTEISISQAGDLPAVGDMVTIGGAPAPAGTHMLQDGSTITVDATGLITAYTAAAPTPPPTPAPVPAPPQPITLSAESVQDMYSKFATGTPEERLANAEIMIKALMENSFGWKIREGNENQAILVYKETMTPTPTVSIEQMNSAFEKADAQAIVIAKHEETIRLLMDLTEQLVEMPTADPVTLTGTKKDKFEKQNTKEQRLDRIATVLKENKSKVLA